MRPRSSSVKLPGRATPEGTRLFAERFGAKSIGFYRSASDLLVSTLGIGTNRGARDDETDTQYCNAVHAALCRGINLVDTSLNYRHQRSERAVGAGIRAFVKRSNGARDGLVVCTKGGFLVPDSYAESVVEPGEVAGGIHCMTPAFLADQIERSRNNLALDTIDVYYLHNPDVQLAFVEPLTFMARVRASFEYLEGATSAGFIGYYGAATWSGYSSGELSLRAMVHAAREIAGEDHHFRFVQVPFNVGMDAAYGSPVDDGQTVLQVARELGVTTIASAALGRARNTRRTSAMPSCYPQPLVTSAQLGIQFVRSTPGITAALVGMRSINHIEENLAVARVPPLNYVGDPATTNTPSDSSYG